MKKLYVVYCKASGKTGRNLFETFKKNPLKGYQTRRSNKKPPQQTPDIFVRWGNGYRKAPEGAIEINTLEAVQNASNKDRMITLLEECNNVNSLKVYRTKNQAHADGLADHDKVYIRGVDNKVRYSTVYDFSWGDQYMTKPVEKSREFRIHVVGGIVEGVYEKEPNEGNTSNLWKDDNCRFRRLDQANRELMSGIIGVREQAKYATKCLGLDMSGVDVIKDTDGNLWVNEVNSAPGLNTPNLIRWRNRIVDMIKAKLEDNE